MPKHKRVTVRGKGADLFFGDLPPDPIDGDNDELVDDGNEIEPVEDSADIQEDAPLPPANPAVEQESKHASNGQASGENNAELISSAILDAVWRDLAEQATVTNAFRYTHEELGQLTDAIYELGKEYGTRVTKQEVARLGLNAILTDYQIRGSESLLSSFIARRSDVDR